MKRFYILHVTYFSKNQCYIQIMFTKNGLICNQKVLYLYYM